MPGMGGVEPTRHISTMAPLTRVPASAEPSPKLAAA